MRRFAVRASARLLALVLGLLLALVTLELLLRTIDSVPRQKNSRRAFHDSDPKVGWVGARNYSAYFRRDGFAGLTTFGPDGFRVVEGAADAPPDAPLVACLGDSYGWGYGVSQGEVYVDHLQEALGDSARIANFSITGFGTGQQLLLLEDRVLALRPAVVLKLFCPNDLHDNVDPWSNRRPWFELHGEEIVRHNVPVERPMSDWTYRLARRSLALNALRYVANDLGDKVRGSGAVRAAPATRVAVPDGLWELERALLREMRDACRGAEPPAQFRVAYATALAELRGETRTVARLAQLCAELEIPFLDPGAEFRAAWHASQERSARGAPLLFEQDTHWSAEGHALFARVLLEHLDWPLR